MATVKTILPPEQVRTLLRIAPYCRVSSGSDDQQHSFAAQHNELANRVSKLRIQRSKLLNLDKGDDTLNQLRALADTIGGMEVPMVQFDEPLIRSVVEKVVVVSPTKIEICLQGGLTFTEHLPEKKRRYSRKEGIA